MRTITLTCALLILVGCQKPTNEEAVVMTGTPNDSSPIVISDGSIHVKHQKANRDHFRNVHLQSAEIEATHYGYDRLGYQCDPSYNANTCTSTCTSPVVVGCSVDISPANTRSWSLSLCEGINPCTAAAAKVTVASGGNGSTSDTKKMSITSTPLNLQYSGPTAVAGADLAYQSAPPVPLQSALLTVTRAAGMDAPYNFTCPANATCLTLAFACRAGGKKCDPTKP